MNTITLSTRLEKRRIHWGKIGSYAILILFAIIYLGPLLMLINTSLKTTPSFMKDPLAFASEFQLQNFVEAWNKANFPKYLLNSLIYTVGGTSIMGLMMLAAGPGSTITVEASGKEAAEVIDAIESLIGGRFDEDD